MSKKYSTKEAIELLKSWGTPFSRGTLEVWRCHKEGPAYIKTKRKVFYTEEALTEFTRGLEIKTIDSHILREAS